MTLHRRQFIIYKEKIKKNDFINIELADNLYFSYHKDLQVIKIDIPNSNDKAYLLGHAFQVDPKKHSPIEEIKKQEFTSLESCYESWSGRWILLYNNEIHMDFTGNLGVFYTTADNENLCISSSCSLISEITGNKAYPNLIETKHGKGMDWYPGPKSVLENVNRLLPSQVLIFEKNSIRTLYREPINNKYHDLSDSQKINLITEYLETLIRNISNEYDGQIILPLTSGFDSRSILSVLLKCKVNFSTLTLQHRYITSSDKSIPKILAKNFNFTHNYIKRHKKLNKNKLAEFDYHTAKNCVDADRLFYAHDQFPQVNKALLLRGGVWGTTKNHYYKMESHPNMTFQEVLQSINKYFYTTEKNTFVEDSLKEWFEYHKSNNSTLDWRDMLFLEQRDGAWLSSVEQALDLTDFDRIHPINSKLLVSLLMSLSSDFRKNNNHQYQIIHIAQSLLTEYSFNNKSLFDKVRKPLIKTTDKIKDYGVLGSFRKLINKLK